MWYMMVCIYSIYIYTYCIILPCHTGNYATYYIPLQPFSRTAKNPLRLEIRDMFAGPVGSSDPINWVFGISLWFLCFFSQMMATGRGAKTLPKHSFPTGSIRPRLARILWWWHGLGHLLPPQLWAASWNLQDKHQETRDMRHVNVSNSGPIFLSRSPWNRWCHLEIGDAWIFPSFHTCTKLAYQKRIQKNKGCYFTTTHIQ